MQRYAPGPCRGRQPRLRPAAAPSAPLGLAATLGLLQPARSTTPRSQRRQQSSASAASFQLQHSRDEQQQQQFSPPSALSSIPKPRASSWLADAVPNIVRSCRIGGSQLHVIRRTASSSSAVDVHSYPVPDAAEGSVEYWRQCVQQARLEHADGFVLVRPIASPSSCCGNPSCCEAEAAASPPWSSSDAAHTASLAAPSQRQPLPASRSGDAPPPPPPDPCTSYYGVVVQTSAELGPGAGVPDDGCFLLKLCQAAGAGAGAALGCTHYSMTRVCQGQSLHAQLRDSWLSSA